MMQIKSVIIDDTHFINLITFNISTFFLFTQMKNVDRLIHPCVLLALRCANRHINWDQTSTAPSDQSGYVNIGNEGVTVLFQRF